MSININFFRHLLIQYFSLNTIPLAILVLAMAEFLLFHAPLDWAKKFYNFLTGAKISNKSHIAVSENFQVFDGIKNPDFDFSQNQHGGVCREDVEIVLKSLGIFCSPETEDSEVQERLNFEDLGNLFEEKKPGLDEVKEAFDVFDENRDGFIDAQDLQRILLVLGLKEGKELENCRKMIRVFDENGDDRIDFDEFVKFMESLEF